MSASNLRYVFWLLHCYAQSPSTMTFANWTFSAKNMTRIPNAIGISICANANRNMWFNLSTMANLGVSVSRLPTPYVMHNFGMYSECSFVMLIKSLYLVSKTNFRTFRFADGYGSWIVCRSNFVRHYGCSYPHVHRLVRRPTTLCQVWYKALILKQTAKNVAQFFSSRARFQENRSIFNTANPRLMNVSLMKDTKSAAQARSKKQRKSMRNTSMIPDTLTNTAGGITSNSLFIRTAYSAFLIHLKYEY